MLVILKWTPEEPFDESVELWVVNEAAVIQGVPPLTVRSTDPLLIVGVDVGTVRPESEIAAGSVTVTELDAEQPFTESVTVIE